MKYPTDLVFEPILYVTYGVGNLGKGHIIAISGSAFSTYYMIEIR